MLSLVFHGYESACTTPVVTATFTTLAGDQLAM